MRRDLNLLRRIVLKIEESPTAWAPKDLSIQGYTAAQVSYHAYLLVNAGLAYGSDTTCLGSEGPEALISHLTWAGHEFADAARNDTHWNRAMGLVKDKGGAITVEILVQLLTGFMRNAFGLP